MIINNQTSNVLEVVGEATSKTSTIDMNEIGKLSYILTEGLYKDALSAVIVEMSNNGIDSILESGKDPIQNPVVVNLTTNSLSIKDEGLGMDKDFFETKFMKLLFSTKGQNSEAIGFFGLGSKSYASLQRSITFTIVKDGIKCKYLCWKGEELIDYDLLLEEETTECNSLEFQMPLNYGEYGDLVKKAKQKLAYYDTVVLLINGSIWENKIYRNDLFQYTLNPSYYTMHLCLKDVVYEMDWDKLGIPSINLPIAIRFGLSDGITPTPSREGYLSNKATIDLIKVKIKEVADFFVDKYNESIKESIKLWGHWDNINSHNKYVELQDKKFEITPLLDFSTIPPETIKIEGIKLKSASWYKSKNYDVFNHFPIKAEYNYNATWKTTRLYTSLDRKFSNKEQVMLINSLTGNIKEYLKEKCGRSSVFVYLEKRNLQWYRSNILTNIPKEKWREHIVEWQGVIKSIQESFCKDYRDIELTKSYEDWLVGHKQDLKDHREKNPTLYKTLNKQDGDVTIAYARTALLGNGVVFEKAVYKLDSLSKTPRQIVVFNPTQTELAKSIAPYLLREKAAVIGIREFSKIKNHQFVSWEKFMENKAFKRIATAMLAEITIKKYERIYDKKHEIINNCISHLKDDIQLIKDYRYKNLDKASINIENAILETAKLFNLWDESIKFVIDKVEKSLKTFDFIQYLVAPSSWEESKTREVTLLINQMLLFRKKYKGDLEDYELIHVPKTEELEAV